MMSNLRCNFANIFKASSLIWITPLLTCKVLNKMLLFQFQNTLTLVNCDWLLFMIVFQKYLSEYIWFLDWVLYFELQFHLFREKFSLIYIVFWPILDLDKIFDRLRNYYFFLVDGLTALSPIFQQRICQIILSINRCSPMVITNCFFV
jgi:hypothetical protein